MGATDVRSPAQHQNNSRRETSKKSPDTLRLAPRAAPPPQMLSFCHFLSAPNNSALQTLIEEQRAQLRWPDYALLTGPPKRYARDDALSNTSQW